MRTRPPCPSCILYHSVPYLQGYTPFVYFCRFGKDVLRSAQIGRMSPKEAQKDTSWGLRVKLDVQKAVSMCAASASSMHWVDPAAVGTADGSSN